MRLTGGGRELRMGLCGMHRRLDDARATEFTRIPRLAYSMASDLVAAFRAALCQRREHRWHAGHRVVDQACRDLDDMAAALLLHLGDGELRGVEEPGGVDAQIAEKSASVYWVKGLPMKMPALLTSVSMRPNRVMPSGIARSAVLRSAMSPDTVTMSSSLEGLIDRAVATTR